MMQTFLVLSWVAILALSVAVLALARQIGVLHERIKPVGALSMGKTVEIGEPTTALTVSNLNGGATRVGGPRNDGRASLLIFVSPTCPICKTLMPVFVSVAEQESDWLQLTFCSDGDEVEHRKIIADNKLSALPYILSREVGMNFQIGKLPYAVLIAADGTLVAHGLVNNREHIESLFEVLGALDMDALEAVVMLGTGLPTLPTILGQAGGSTPVLSPNLCLMWRTLLAVSGTAPSRDNLAPWLAGEGWGDRLKRRMAA